MLLATLNDARAVGWICLFVGILVLAAGVAVGLLTSLAKAPKAEADQLKKATEKLDAAKASLTPGAGLEAGSAKSASTAVDEAKSALEQVGSIVGSLPENLRFAGLLVLIGAVLISVATIQFGGTSLF